VIGAVGGVAMKLLPNVMLSIHCSIFHSTHKTYLVIDNMTVTKMNHVYLSVWGIVALRLIAVRRRYTPSDWVAVGLQHTAKKEIGFSLANIAWRQQSPLVTSIGKKLGANDSAERGISSDCMDLHPPWQHLHPQCTLVSSEVYLQEMQPKTGGEKGLWVFGKCCHR